MTDGLFILCLFPNTTMDPFYPLLALSRNGPRRTDQRQPPCLLLYAFCSGCHSDVKHKSSFSGGCACSGFRPLHTMCTMHAIWCQRYIINLESKAFTSRICNLCDMEDYLKLLVLELLSTWLQIQRSHVCNCRSWNLQMLLCCIMRTWWTNSYDTGLSQSRIPNKNI